MTRRFLAALLACSLGASACEPTDAAARSAPELAAREARLEDSLAHRDSGSASGPIARWMLPSQLREISGLALSADGRLFAHGDEIGQVLEIDYRRGVIVKQFFIGEQTVRDDFEGMAVVNGTFYVITSKGLLYAFAEGKNHGRVAYKTYDTKLAKECEFEGVAYDPAIKSLLLACKNVLARDEAGQLLIYKWGLDTTGTTHLTRLAVPQALLIGDHAWKQLRPSDIAVDPVSGNYVMVAAQERALLAITPAGEVVFARPLADPHPQAEGVAVTKDGILLISDEGGQRSAFLTLYRWP